MRVVYPPFREHVIDIQFTKHDIEGAIELLSYEDYGGFKGEALLEVFKEALRLHIREFGDEK